MEQFVKQALLGGAARWFAATGWLDDGFATTNGFANWLTATNRLASCVATGVTTAKERLHVAKGTCTGSISGEQRDSQNSRY
tara:strand:- start:238 stop:483 length:246 start_codon:yes stop_codon:yes gene_type:complete